MNRTVRRFRGEEPQLTANFRQQFSGNTSAPTNLRLIQTGKLSGSVCASHADRSMPDRHAAVESPSLVDGQQTSPPSLSLSIPMMDRREARQTWVTDRNRLPWCKLHNPSKTKRHPLTCPAFLCQATPRAGHKLPPTMIGETAPIFSPHIGPVLIATASHCSRFAQPV